MEIITELMTCSKPVSSGVLSLETTLAKIIRMTVIFIATGTLNLHVLYTANESRTQNSRLQYML